MNSPLIIKKFARVGARAKLRPRVRDLPPTPRSRPLIIDIGQDRRGEFFDLQTQGQPDVEVLDLRPDERHLLLMVRRPGERPGLPDIKDKFLCGHDERHWFVAAVPEGRSVSSVVTAKEALKPRFVLDLEQGRPGKRVARHRRKTETFVRQGEWFFVPARGIHMDTRLVLRNEPLRRGRGKPHTCEQLVRTGGVTVYVCSAYPNGLTQPEYRALLSKRTTAGRWNWQVMRRDPAVFVRGRVSHADHATIRLDGWHRVAMNTENEARSFASVAFLD